MMIEHQVKPRGKFAENIRFLEDGAMFVGLNIPGSNNNKVNSTRDCTKRSARTPEQSAADNAEYIERDTASRDVFTFHPKFVPGN